MVFSDFSHHYMNTNLTFVLSHAQDLVNENVGLKLKVDVLTNEIQNKDRRIKELEKMLQESAKLQTQ